MIFTFFFLDFFLLFPFSGVESKDATDPRCEAEDESSFDVNKVGKINDLENLLVIRHILYSTFLDRD